MTRIKIDWLRQKLKHRQLAASWLAALVMMLTACTDPPKVTDDDIRTVDHKTLSNWLDAAQQNLADQKEVRLAIIDVRTLAQFEAAHLPLAVHRTLPQLVAGDSQFARARSIVVYGQGPSDRLALAAVKKMLALRYDHVWLYRGGMADWREHGGKIVLPAG